MMLKFRRIIAYNIDFIVCFSIPYVPALIIMDLLGKKSIVAGLAMMMAMLLFSIMMICKDLLFRNASIGKKIVGIAIYFKDEIPPKKLIIKRNLLTVIVPTYPFSVLFYNKSYGDFICFTEVKKRIKLK